MSDAANSSATTIGDLLRTNALHEADAAARLLARRGAALHRGVHEARRAIRRMRSTLRLGLPALGERTAAILDELKELAESLSAARDADVAVETLKLLAEDSDDASVRRLLSRAGRRFAERRARQYREMLREDPGLALRLGRLQRLRGNTALLPWAALNPHVVHAGIASSMLRARRLGDRAHDSAKGDLRHRWRRRLRRLRQQLRIVESELGWLLSTRESWSWPDPTSESPGALVLVEVKPKTIAAITDRLGFEHDLRALRGALRRSDDFDPAARAALRGIIDEALRKAVK